MKMNKIVFNSFRLINLSSIQSRSGRKICIKCLNFNQNYGNYFSNPKKTFSPIFSYISYNFRQNLSFVTFSSRNQRLNQIYRNANKEKTSKGQNLGQMNEWQQMTNLSLTKKLKFMFTKFWYISIPVHMITSVLWFGTSYLIAKSGFNVKPILEWIKPYSEKLPLPEFVLKILNSDTNASSAGYVAIALIIYKLVSPARYAATVGLSYYAIQFGVKRGLIKPAPTGQQIRAQVNKSGNHLKKVLRERINKRQELRKKSKNKRHK